jgi:hypothetical protein
MEAPQPPFAPRSEIAGQMERPTNDLVAAAAGAASGAAVGLTSQSTDPAGAQHLYRFEEASDADSDVEEDAGFHRFAFDDDAPMEDDDE